MTLGEEEYPGLDLLMAVALAEREAQADDFRALDAKAATLAVFPATLAALTVGGWPPLVVLACVFAGLTVWRSICALSLRTVGLPSTMELREQYLSREDQEEACLRYSTRCWCM